MHWRFRLGTPLLLTVVSLITISPAWTAEKVSARTPTKARQKTSEPRSTARAPVTKAKSSASTANSDTVVSPAGYTVEDLQDSLVDAGEAICDPNLLQNQVPSQNPDQRHRFCRDCCLSRVHQTSCDVICTEKENCRDWFNYIRGYGPVVWVRNGPELSCHPPSIPFAKRIGGATAPQWGGVTGIPYQREISPRTIYLIRAEDLKYRVAKIEK